MTGHVDEVREMKAPRTRGCPEEPRQASMPPRYTMPPRTRFGSPPSRLRAVKGMSYPRHFNSVTTDIETNCTYVHPEKAGPEGADPYAHSCNRYLRGEGTLAASIIVVVRQAPGRRVHTLRSNASKLFRLLSRISSTISWVDCMFA